MLASESIADYVQRMLEGAVALGASDIHFEPYEGFYRVRYRVDGVLSEVDQPQLALRERLAARLKVMAGLDISEKRLPQDGRFSLQLLRGAVQNVRMSTLPTLFGEKIVLRLLAPTLALPLVELGLEPGQLALLQQAIAWPHGLLLVTGPTGSGKSATLYACLAALNQQGVNICTVEDPVEIALSGVNQVAVNEKIGLGFALTLRALLRQDPDVMMVGEMRDALTADIAVKAAQTGHRVWSSLHTNSAQAALARLLNMEVAWFNLASALSLIVSQRLARRLCDACKQPGPLSLTLLKGLGWQGALPPEAHCCVPTGCPACHGSGYRGRLGIFELLPLSEEALSGLWLDGALQLPPPAFPDLRRAGLMKALRGEISLAEAAAVTPT